MDKLLGNIFIKNGSEEEQEKYMDTASSVFEDVEFAIDSAINDYHKNGKIEIFGQMMDAKEIMNKVFGDSTTGKTTCSVDEAVDLLNNNVNIAEGITYSNNDLRLAIEYVRCFGI